MRWAQSLLVVACAALANAQSAPPAAVPPKILMLVRQRFYPAKTNVRDKLERAIAADYYQLDIPVYWLEYQAFTGPDEALLFKAYDSALENAGVVRAPLNDEHPELARYQAGIDDALLSQTTILAVRQDSPHASEINLATTRFLRMLLVRTGPGGGPPAIELPSSITYQVISGIPGPAYFVFQALTDVTEFPAVHTTSGNIVEDSVYAIDPRMSHVSREFAAGDRVFWTKPPAEPTPSK